jgi:hypothetical protein
MRRHLVIISSSIDSSDALTVEGDPELSGDILLCLERLFDAARPKCHSSARNIYQVCARESGRNGFDSAQANVVKLGRVKPSKKRNEDFWLMYSNTVSYTRSERNCMILRHAL